jgi:nucleoside-diphosphate-sugar epimerase
VEFNQLLKTLLERLTHGAENSRHRGHWYRRRVYRSAIGLSRRQMVGSHVDWVHGDLTLPHDLKLPPFDRSFRTADARLLVLSLSCILNQGLKRLVFFTSTSISTKKNSEIESERIGMQAWAEAEARIIEMCERRNIEWTALRPTLIYAEGRDHNITTLSHLIMRLGFLPIVGSAEGLRQPVHAEDVAKGAVSASRHPAAANKIYVMPGGETITYREMVGRIFDGLNKRRLIIPVPEALWKLGFWIAKPLFPHANVAWGTRMRRDMIFDGSKARRDFGWQPRGFHPDFSHHVTSSRASRQP